MGKENLAIRSEFGNVFNNLTGVFMRSFPVVMGMVAEDGITRTVTYYGDKYTVSAQ